MSAYNDLDITCEQCGEEFRGTVWTAIHAGVDPELKDLLLGGELNMVMCPKCSHVAYQDHFLIYQEPDDELVAYVYPENQQEQESELRQMMLKGFRDAQETFPAEQRLAYEPILIFGLESLVELIHQELDWAEQSDVAEAVCREKNMPFKRISPAESRRLQLPRVLPLATPSKSPNRANVIAGFQALLKENTLLSIYADRLKTLEANTAWVLA